MKILLGVLLSLAWLPAFATEITPSTLIGDYSVQASALFKKVYANIYVLNTQEFELQRTYPDGRKDPRCQGTYTLSNGFVFIENVGIQAGKILQGYATCPDDRQKKLDFRIEFGNNKIEDLQRGTNVYVRSSLSSGVRVNAYVKKQ